MDWLKFMYDLIAVFGFSLLGIILMALGYKILDWVVPADFNKELEKGNLAVGVVVAGLLIGIALIIARVVGV
ncbi:putative membrane protein [Clostridium bornimense]|uniref:Putative membrane protein n=1 Tax=Clostridium bornimense TaxID=1216932 RepID=W6RUL5_9CLOT|nr:DUF350 domain-containing protein [Clostridium bornimense]CDM68351.1 putative membrane protein [Clostridium bornimense]